MNEELKKIIADIQEIANNLDQSITLRERYTMAIEIYKIYKIYPQTNNESDTPPLDGLTKNTYVPFVS